MSEPQRAGTVAFKILATPGHAKAQQTTAPQASGCDPRIERENGKLKQRAWLDRWLKLKTHHPQLVELEAAVHGFCMGYAKTPAKGSRLVIYGENGTGKSHAAKAVFNWASQCANKLRLVHSDEDYRLPKAEYWNWPSLVDKLKDGQWHLIEEMLSAELLVLDDVGAEHDPSKVGAQKFYLLLEHRQTRWTVITTNVTPGAWADRFERRVSSRLFRNSLHVPTDQVPDYSTISN